MSTTSFQAEHGSAESNSQSRSVSRRRFANLEDPQKQTGRSHQLLRYLIDTCIPVTETLQDPSHVPGARSQINLDDPLFKAPSQSASKGGLAEIDAQFSEQLDAAGRPAKLASADLVS